MAVDNARTLARLYLWLGEQVVSEQAELVEEAANLDKSVGPAYRAEAFQEARMKLRQLDARLPYVPAIDNLVI
jgi:hypothetical protein